MRATKALIHLESLRSNIRGIKRLLKPGTKLCIAMKADAYGHGAARCAQAALEAGADFLSVATVEEGIELRNAGICAPILLLSLCSPDEIDSAVEYRISPFVFDSEYISCFASACRKAGITDFCVHLAVDTGMGRIGCVPEEAGKMAKIIFETGVLSLEGMATHFALSDSVSEAAESYTRMQFERFQTAIDSVKAEGLSPGICHCSNSAAVLNNPEYQLDMVRPGIIAYGYYTDEVSREYLAAKGCRVELRPVMTLESAVCSIRKCQKGQSISYGCTWTAEQDTYIGVIPAGYADGIFRRFSSSGMNIAVNGKSCPVRGRICMDQLMIDLGADCTAQRWDKAVIFGDGADGALQTADDIARMTGTIPYEITCGISRRVPRVFTG